MKKNERAVDITRFAIRQAKKLVRDELNLDEFEADRDFRIAVLNITNRNVDLMRED